MKLNLIRLFFLSFTLSAADGLAQNLSLNTFLANEVIETSGLAYLNGKIITHNDSGGAAALYEIDSLTGQVTRTVFLSNATNTDWEDISLDQDYIYIGDFGNNTGSRTDLKVYRLSIDDYVNTPNDSVWVDTINFSYSNQSDFTAGSNSTNFDAEALLSYGNELMIFSKNWLDNNCDVYSLSKIPGTYSISKIDSFDSEGLITGACYNANQNELLLCGYGPPIPFLIKLSNFSNGQFSNGTIQKTTLQVPNGSSVQIEAISQKANNSYFLSAETSVLGDAALSSFDPEAITSSIASSGFDRLILPNPVRENLYVELGKNENLEIYNLLGELILQSFDAELTVKDLSPGKYFLVIKNKNQVILSHRVLIKE